MEFTDFRELKRLMTNNAMQDEFEFETHGHEAESYDKNMI